MSARSRLVTLLALALSVAAVLTVTGARLAASQTPRLVALGAGSVPATDPFDRFWDDLRRIEIPLSAQQVVPPKSEGPLPFLRGTRWSLWARAVHDERNLFLLVEWTDRTADRSVFGVTDFTDAVAVQFPGEPAQAVPALCMGDPAATVNIWQWKAAWQQLVERPGGGGTAERYANSAVDDYPFRDEEVFYPGRYLGNPLSQRERSSSVDNLVAGGFGSLTPDPTDAVTGWGAWRDGKWRVVFVRPLHLGREGNIDLAVGDQTDVAFAVWDGAARERDGEKSVGNFVTLEISQARLPGGGSKVVWLWLLLLLVPVWLVAAAKRSREPAR